MTPNQTPTPRTDEAEPAGGLVGSAINDQLRRELAAKHDAFEKVQATYEATHAINVKLREQRDAEKKWADEVDSQLRAFIDRARSREDTTEWLHKQACKERDQLRAEKERADAWESTLEAYGVEPERVLEKIKALEKRADEAMEAIKNHMFMYQDCRVERDQLRAEVERLKKHFIVPYGAALEKERDELKTRLASLVKIAEELADADNDHKYVDGISGCPCCNALTAFAKWKEVEV